MLCIFPLQDILGFGGDCKMNSPGIAEGNWRWRCGGEFLTPDVAAQLQASTRRFNRGNRREATKKTIVNDQTIKDILNRNKVLTSLPASVIKQHHWPHRLVA